MENSENNVRNLDAVWKELRIYKEKNELLIKLIEECGLGYKTEDTKKD